MPRAKELFFMSSYFFQLQLVSEGEKFLLKSPLKEKKFKSGFMASQFLEVQRSGQHNDLEGQVERSIADNMHLLHKILYYDYVQAKQNCLLKA